MSYACVLGFICASFSGRLNWKGLDSKVGLRSCSRLIANAYCWDGIDESRSKRLAFWAHGSWSEAFVGCDGVSACIYLEGHPLLGSGKLFMSLKAVFLSSVVHCALCPILRAAYFFVSSKIPS